jgi:hypothetical protein
LASRLVWLQGTGVGQARSLTDRRLTIGRSSECELVVQSERASRHHAVVVPVRGGYELSDQGSSNGTRLNGQRLQFPTRLRHGDLIDIGDERFRYEERRAGAAATRIGTPAIQHGARRALAPRIGLFMLLVALLSLTAGISTTGRRAALWSGQLPRFAASTMLAMQPAASPPRASSGQADWTVLVYLDGDNDLERDAVADFNEMELVGSSDHVQLAVQFDRLRGGRSSLFDDDWTGTRRYHVMPDPDPNRIASPVLADLGEQNMGAPQTLADFVIWGVRSFPAQHYALVIWDHGSAWAGIAFDDTSGKDGLTLSELDTALRTAQAATALDRLDLIGFDACVMGQIDVLTTIAPYARVAVASPDLEPNAGWPWDRLLARMQADPTIDARGLGQVSVETYGQAYAGDTSASLGLTAFDLASATRLRDQLGAFSDALIADLDNAYRPVAEARSYVTVYSQPRPEEFNAVDLGQLARLTAERGAPAQVAAAARGLADAIDQARIARWGASTIDGTGGLSAFFPQVAERYPAFYAQVSPIAQQTSWARFLQAFYTAGPANVMAPRIGDLAVTAASEGGAQLLATLAGEQIAHVFFFVGIPNADRSGVQLVTIDYSYPPGSAADTAPSWGAGPNSLNERWDGMQWAIAGAGAHVPVLLGPVRYGSDLYGVEGRYQAQDGALPIDAALLFQRQGSEMVLQSVYGFPRGQYQEAQPFELRPAAGDTFTAQIRTYSIHAGQLEAGRVDGGTIVFGSIPLHAQKIAVAPGNYVAGFLVRDIAGHFSYQYRDLRVGG